MRSIDVRVERLVSLVSAAEGVENTKACVVAIDAGPLQDRAPLNFTGHILQHSELLRAMAAHHG
jgi:hypothetical protein